MQSRPEAELVPLRLSCAWLLYAVSSRLFECGAVAVVSVSLVDRPPRIRLRPSPAAAARGALEAASPTQLAEPPRSLCLKLRAPLAAAEPTQHMQRSLPRHHLRSQHRHSSRCPAPPPESPCETRSAVDSLFVLRCRHCAVAWLRLRNAQVSHERVRLKMIRAGTRTRHDTAAEGRGRGGKRAKGKQKLDGLRCSLCFFCFAGALAAAGEARRDESRRLQGGEQRLAVLASGVALLCCALAEPVSWSSLLCRALVCCPAMSSPLALSKLKPEQQVKELSKKKSNKNCFDCGRSGPQQNVNTTTNTFVCTQCAGIQSATNTQHTATQRQTCITTGEGVAVASCSRGWS